MKRRRKEKEKNKKKIRRKRRTRRTRTHTKKKEKHEKKWRLSQPTPTPRPSRPCKAKPTAASFVERERLGVCCPASQDPMMNHPQSHNVPNPASMWKKVLT